MHLDPLNPSLHEKSGATVAHMDSVMSPALINQSVYYQGFLKPFDFRYVTDIFGVITCFYGDIPRYS